MIKIKDKRVLIKKGDITQEDSDAIVNPANDTLQHGGGAAAAIVKSGGIEIQIDSDKLIRNIGLLPTGKAVITYGHNLQAKFIIHTVGPKMGEGNEENKLKKSVLNALNLAESYNLKSISIPAISSGIFGFPKDKCAEILLETTVEFFKKKDTSLNKVVMCNFDEKTCNIFLEKSKKYLLK